MANKVVQLVDKNSNNLYPVAGFVKDDAVSTGAISSQAVTTAKIANGAVTGVANDATAIGTAKLALDTVGTPNLRDASVTSNKIDWTTIHVNFGTKTVAAGGIADFSAQVPEITDNDFIADFRPYVSGGSSADCMICGSYRGDVAGTDEVKFTVKNTGTASRSWTGWAHIKYIKQ